MENRIENHLEPNTHANTKSRYETRRTLMALIFLAGGFWTLTQWFKIVDVYHTNFFNDGSIVFTYNQFRIIFAFYILWIIYASGYLLLFTLIPRISQQAFSLSERVIISFGIGLGFWHLLMLVLGVCNLYYHSIMIVLCLIILAGSSSHFKQVVREVAACFHKNKFSSSNKNFAILTGILIASALFWLLLVRGLYPGGGGDYFTHYFYYYLNVVHNHGLAPNDVWYHYYYSKGAGLHFLGMLLTDPEAPQIITFCCVAIATLSLTNLTNRFAPNSLWPAFCALLYIAYNLVGISGGGGEFQKTHEETTAIVIIATWVICLYHLEPKKWEKPAFISMSALMVGAAIITQAIAIFFIMFFAVQISIALFQKKWREMWFYILLCGITSITVMSIFLLNYFVTGLATDQSLNITWRFANLERLNQWGVIPNIMLVAWIRDNYDMLAIPFGWKSIYQLISFMRIDVLWVLIITTFSTLFFTLLIFVENNKPTSSLFNTIIKIALLLATFGILSLFAGHSQAASYFRFSSFFFPLITLLCVLCWAFIGTQWKISNLLPVFIFFVILFSWHHWSRQAHHVTNNAFRFMSGRYSLANAYSHQPVGLAFGGIHPGAYEAMLHTPRGSRIWSTSVDTYCMAPHCQIESVISFKLSSHLNEILNGTPEEAKKILQQEGLNYFLFTNDGLLLDLLPYSSLFNPSTISKYLAIKWTNRTTYLLTWPGPDTRPIDEAFLRAYKRHLALPEHSWFRFSKAVPELNETMKILMQSPHPWHPIEFPWRKQMSLYTQNNLNS